jgi:hypothetical protein
VIGEKLVRVVIVLGGHFAEEDERPGDGNVVGHLPFGPYTFESFPGTLCCEAFQQAMECGFFCVEIANFASRVNSDELQPGAYREALVERQPDERSHLTWARVVPKTGDHLRGCRVPEIEVLHKGQHFGGVCGPSGVRISSFGCVAKE